MRRANCVLGWGPALLELAEVPPVAHDPLFPLVLQACLSGAIWELNLQGLVMSILLYSDGKHLNWTLEIHFPEDHTGDSPPGNT